MTKYIITLLCIAVFFSCASENNSKSVKQESLETKQPISSQKMTTPEVKKEIPIDFIMGKFNPAVEADFIEVPAKYASRKGMYMQRAAYDAFVKMADAAKEEDISLQVISAARNFFRQKSIWEAKWNGQTKVGGKDLSKSLPVAKSRALKILEFSSMPGTSRHHWGTDIDINNLNNSYFNKGRGQKEYEWLQKNAAKFGYCQPYSPIDEARPNGYFEEKWHWSYMPLSQPLTDAAEARLRNEMITGFDGSETAPEIDVVRNFVLGINQSCRH